MSNNVINDVMIKRIYQEYQIKYNLKLPKIHKIQYVNNKGFWARFITTDLFNKNYKLYIEKNLLSQNKNFIKQILFHEFTHLYDSIQFLNKPLNEFKNIMVSYSEFNASKVEMIERLEEINDININLQCIVNYTNPITLNKLMQDTFDVMKLDLEKMYNNKDKNNLYYNSNSIYYFYGYVKALFEYNIDYSLPTHNLYRWFYIQITKIETILLSKNINVDNVLTSYIELQEAITNQLQFNILCSL